MAFGNASKGYVRQHSGGGGGGASNYNQLTNKPQINGVELTGNKSSSDLGINNVDYISYVGDNDRTRAFEVGTYKALRFFVSGTSTTHASTNLISLSDSNYYTTWIESGSIRTGVGSVVRDGNNIRLSGADAGQEFNESNINYCIQIFR